MSNKSLTNPKGAGRPNSEKKTFPVRCHPNIIKDVRNYAKIRSAEEQKRILSIEVSKDKNNTLNQ